MTMTITKSWLSSLSLASAILLAGCNNMVSVPAPDTQPIKAPNHTAIPSHPNANTLVQCGPFDPNEHMACTMQFDPVCVTEKTPNGLKQRTAGNACSACNTPAAVSYVPGECQ